MKEERAPVSKGLAQALEEANAIFVCGFKEMEEVKELGWQIWRESMERLKRKKELRVAFSYPQAEFLTEFTISKVPLDESLNLEAAGLGMEVGLKIVRKDFKCDESQARYWAKKDYFFSPGGITTIFKPIRSGPLGLFEPVAEAGGIPDKDELRGILKAMGAHVSFSPAKLLPPGSR